MRLNSYQQHTMMIPTNVIFMFVVSVAYLWMSVLPSHPPMTVKRKLTYFTYPTTWKDAQIACSRINGSLVKDSTHGTSAMIELYSENEWDAFWDNDVWNGLFISDINIPRYKWVSDCSIHDTSLFHLFITIPSPDELDPNQKCVFESYRNWDFEVCNSVTRSFICQEDVGPCTYDRDVVTGACTKGIEATYAIRNVSLDECEAYCTSIYPLTIGLGQCWSVTFVSSSRVCFPAIDTEPHAFDVTTTGYEPTCTQTEVIAWGNDSIVSWKRCFQKPGVVLDSVTTTMSDYSLYDPSDICYTATTSDSFVDGEATEQTTEWSGTTPDLTTQQSETTPDLTTQQNETTPGLTTQQSETTPDLTTRQSETTPDLTTQQSETTPDLTTQQYETTPGLTTQQSETTPGLTTQQSETTPDLTTQQSETTPDLTTQQSETTPGLTTQQSETTSDLYTTQQSETTSGLDTTQQSESTLGLTTQQSETTQGLDTTQQAETTPGLGTGTISGVITSGVEATQQSETSNGMTTQVSSAMINQAECSCTCTFDLLLSFQEKIEHLKMKTSVNKKKTSNYYRKLSSASDNRVTSRVVGIPLGLGVIIGVVVIILLGDVVTCWNSLRLSCRNRRISHSS